METFMIRRQSARIIAFVLLAVLVLGQLLPPAYAVYSDTGAPTLPQQLTTDADGSGNDEAAGNADVSGNDETAESKTGFEAGEDETNPDADAAEKNPGSDGDEKVEEDQGNQGDTDDQIKEPGGTDEENDESSKEPDAVMSLSDEAEENTPDKLKFGVISDTHNGPSKSKQNAMLEKAVDFYNDVEDLSALVIVGDLTDNGNQSEYNSFTSAIAGKSEDVRLIASMGNHEGNSAAGFQAATGNVPNSHIVMNGYHFITLSPGSGTFNPETGRGTTQGGGSYSYVADWAKEQMDIAVADDPDKPVFVFFHHPLKDTFYVSNEWYGTGLGDGGSSIFHDYPQAVTFAGHIHSPNNDPRSIWQDGGFTAVNTVTLSYFELEKGMVYGSVPPNASSSGQGLVVEANGSQVNIKNYDFVSDSWIEQEWTFDVSKPEDFPYTKEREEKAQKPVFPEDAVISASVNKEAQSAVVTFTQAMIPESSEVGEVVHSYQYKVINTETGNTVKTFKTWSDFYMLPMTNPLVQEITGLALNTEYEVRIYGIGSYQLTGDEYLSVTFKIEDDEDPFDPDMKVELAELIDVDFEDKKPIDKSPQGHTLITGKGAEFFYDTQLGKYAAHFNNDGDQVYYMNMTQAEYDQILTSSSLEGVFRFDYSLGKSMNFFSNAESAGMYYEFISVGADSAVLEYGIHVGGSYKTVTAEVSADVWHHAMAVFDGQYVRLYIDGELRDSASASGQMKVPADASKRFYIGCDTNGSGNPQFLYQGDVSTARLYSRALTANEVKALALRELADHGQAEEQGKNLVRFIADNAVHIIGNNTSAALSQSLSFEKMQNFNMIYMVFDYDAENFDYAGINVLEDKLTFKDEDVFPQEGRVELTLGVFSDSISVEELKAILKTSFILKSGKEPQECQIKITELQIANQGVEVEHSMLQSVASTELRYGSGFDLNGDGKVDRLDLSLALTWYMITSTDSEWTDGAYKADFNGDGLINIDDFIMLLHAIKTQND